LGALYEFLRMPFGVKNALVVFQELMQRLFEKESEFCTPYMDDVVVFSNDWKTHIEHIDRVLGKLREAGLTANLKKCKWGGKSIEFLGHQVRDGRMSLTSHRAEALRTYTRPCTKKGLRSFLGAISFYRRYVRQLASQTALLTPLTAKQAPPRIVWTQEGERAFNVICATISDSCSLCIPYPQDTTDVSDLGVGGVLQVWCDEKWEAAAFYSRQLRGPE